MKKKHSKKNIRMPVWNLKLLYSSEKDPRIETDIRKFEKNIEAFLLKYDLQQKTYLENSNILHQALIEYEKLVAQADLKAYLYFYYLRDIDAAHPTVSARLSLTANRLTKAQNKLIFFENSLGKISPEKQQDFLADSLLSNYSVFLRRIFKNAIYDLSVPEERILNLKTQPAHEMWTSANENIMNLRTVSWKGKTIPLSEASQMIHTLPTQKERHKLAEKVSEVLKDLSTFSEKEINAIYINKKIDDELRGYKTPYEQTVINYNNDPVVIDQLVSVVGKHTSIAHNFFKLKAKLLKQKKLFYSDRDAKIGNIKKKFSFTSSLDILRDMYQKIDPKYSDILNSYIAKGQIDAPPRIGKSGGAYCSSTYLHPTFVLLNHTDDFHSFTTLAHEMGHAFHSELSRSQGPIYSSYSISLAETASTLFESLALETVFDSLSDVEKITVLHDKINDDISTIFRQIACFNFEKELHENIRTKGYLSKEEIADLHNKNMKSYLGPIFKLDRNDGYAFVQWSHIRRFFYVYSYAYGMLVSKAFLRRHKQDPSFWSSIEIFLSAGGKDSPENILKEIGIDVYKLDFWEEGLREIEADIIKLEKLTKK